MEDVASIIVEKGKVFHRGAEAIIYIVHYLGEKAVLKHRVRKKYRDPVMDSAIIKSRTYKEAYVLKILEDINIPAPRLYYASIKDGILIMSYIEGELLRDVLLRNRISDKMKIDIFRKLGEYISNMHNNGITHGDLTTSNIIFTEDEEIYLIDFGLANINSSIEEKSVDIEMFDRVLVSTHTNDAEMLFKAFIDAYTENAVKAEEILKRYQVIKRSGRYHEV